MPGYRASAFLRLGWFCTFFLCGSPFFAILKSKHIAEPENLRRRADSDERCTGNLPDCRDSGGTGDVRQSRRPEEGAALHPECRGGRGGADRVSGAFYPRIPDRHEFWLQHGKADRSGTGGLEALLRRLPDRRGRGVQTALRRGKRCQSLCEHGLFGAGRGKRHAL